MLTELIILNQNSSGIIINSIFQSVLVEAIRLLADDDDTEMAWKENLKLMINFDEKE